MFLSENALLVVVILEFILAVYAVSLGVVSKHKVIKILNFVFAALWIVLAIVNIVTGLQAQ